MDKSIPKPAVILLRFIYGFESRNSYTTVYGNHEDELTKPITSMTLDELAAAQKFLGKRHGSSAAGAAQFMPPTIIDLRTSMKLTGQDVFSPDLQDRMAYTLLRRRGYASFMSGSLSLIGFGRNLAMEWASMPVLAAGPGAHRKVARGETYYAGDKLNRALVDPAKVEAVLAQVLKAA